MFVFQMSETGNSKVAPHCSSDSGNPPNDPDKASRGPDGKYPERGG